MESLPYLLKRSDKGRGQDSRGYEACNYRWKVDRNTVSYTLYSMFPLWRGVVFKKAWNPFDYFSELHWQRTRGGDVTERKNRWDMALFPILGTIHCWDPGFPSKCSPRLWQLWRSKEDLLLCVKLHVIYYWKQEYVWEQAVISSRRSKELSDPWTLNWNLLNLFCVLTFPNCDCSPTQKMAIINLPAVKQSLQCGRRALWCPSSRYSHNALHCLAKAPSFSFQCIPCYLPLEFDCCAAAHSHTTAAAWGENDVWLQICKVTIQDYSWDDLERDAQAKEQEFSGIKAWLGFHLLAGVKFPCMLSLLLSVTLPRSQRVCNCL